MRTHLPSTRRFLIPSSCHLGADWASGNRWAGRRCVKPQSRGFGCQKGNARARMLFENLDHLRVGRRPRGTYETAWVTPGHDCLCPYEYGHGAAVRPQTNNAIWDGVIGLWCRVAPFLSPWCARENLPTGVNLNRYAVPRSCIRWHSDNGPLFGPQYALKLIVSTNLGNSVEFEVHRRSSSDVPSSITLDHGDLLVMDGPAQLEYAHRMVSELQGPRVNLTYRWVTHHTASWPLAGVVGCVLPSCVQSLAEPSSHSLGVGKINGPLSGDWSSFCQFLSLSCWLALGITLGGGIVTVVSVRPAQRCISPLGNLGREAALATVTTPPISQRSVFLFLLSIFFWGQTMLVSQRHGTVLLDTAGYASWGKAGGINVRPRFPQCLDGFSG